MFCFFLCVVDSQHNSMTSICLALKYLGVRESNIEGSHKTETVVLGRKMFGGLKRHSDCASPAKSFRFVSMDA